MMKGYDPYRWYWLIAGRIWSSSAQGYVETSDPAYTAWSADGTTPTPLGNEEELWEQLRVYAPDRLPDDQRYVPVAAVRERLEAAQLWDAMVAALISAGGYSKLAKVLSLRWGIRAGDEEARTLLISIGADPDQILAPE